MAPISDEIYIAEPADSASSVSTGSRTYLIFYIPGNPGLVEYYRSFLTHLHTSLKAKRPDCDFEILGRSLPGFEVREVSASRVKDRETGPPYNVNQQINFTIREVKKAVKGAKSNGKKDVRVIIMGHSLGSYMSMEVIRLLREEAKDNPHNEGSVRVVGGILLFATVMDLAKSPSGLRLGVRPTSGSA